MKIVELRGARGAIEVTAMGIAPTPEAALAAGEILQPEVVVEALRDLVREAGVRSKDAIISIAGQAAIVVRVTEVPKMPYKELVSTMSFEIEREVPFAADEIRKDFIPLRDMEEVPEGETVPVLYAAVREEVVNTYVDVLFQAGLQPRAIDVEPLAILRTVVDLPQSLSEDGGFGPNDLAIVINIGAESTEVAVLHGGIIAFPRVLPLGGDEFTAAISDALGLDRTEAERVKQEMGTAWIEEPTVQPPESAGPPEEPTAPTIPVGEVPGAPTVPAETEAPEEETFDFDLPSLETEPQASAPAQPEQLAEQPSETVSDQVKEDIELEFTLPGEQKETSTTEEREAEATEREAPGELELDFDFDLEEGTTPAPTAESSEQKETEVTSEFELDLEAPPETVEAPPTQPAEEQEEISEQVEQIEQLEQLEQVEQVGAQAGPPLIEGEGQPTVPAPPEALGEVGAEDMAATGAEFVTARYIFDAIEAKLHDLATEIVRSVEYYTSKVPDAEVKKVYLVGGGARLKNLDRFLEQQLGVPVEVANPFKYLDASAMIERFGEAYVNEIAPYMVIAVGLALRELL